MLRYFCANCDIKIATPIYLCPQNHLSCEDCILRGACHLCKQTITKTRDFGLERRIKVTRIECKWKNCNITLYSDKIRQHEATCSLRLHDCPHFRCDWTGTIKNLKPHFDELHPCSTYVQSSFLRRPADYDEVYYVEAFGEVFTCKFALGQNGAEWEFYFNGAPSRVKYFKCSVELDDTGFKRPCNVRRAFCPMFELDVPYSDIIFPFNYSLTINKIEPVWKKKLIGVSM